MSGKENAEAYLEMCAANNKRPKFYKLLDFDGKGKYSLKKDGSTDGYFKLLIDFKMYDNDGIGSPQMAVTPDFSMDEAMTMLDEYKGGHNTYPVAYDVVDRFVEKYESYPTPSDSAVMSGRKRLDNEDEVGYNKGNKKNGGTNNVEQEENFAEKSRNNQRYHRTSKSHENGRGIPKRDGKSRENPRKIFINLWERRRGLTEESFITPKSGSVEAYELSVLSDYGIEGYVIRKTDWFRKDDATSHNGTVYIREGANEIHRGMIAVHEATHVMKQMSFEPYLEFWDRTADMVNISNPQAQRLLDFVANHRGVEVLDGTLSHIYDELNATIFGHISQGLPSELYEILNEAFYDFDAYARELTEIHKQFKAYQNQNNDVTPSDNSVYQPRETREYTDRELLPDALDSVATSEEDRKKLTQYKKKAAQADELERTLAELRAKKKALEEAKAKRSEIRAVQDEITKTQNRITIIDKQLFKLESTAALKRVLEVEKARRAKQAREKQKALDDKKRQEDRQKSIEALAKQKEKFEKEREEEAKRRKEREAERRQKKDRTELPMCFPRKGCCGSSRFLC